MCDIYLSLIYQFLILIVNYGEKRLIFERIKLNKVCRSLNIYMYMYVRGTVNCFVYMSYTLILFLPQQDLELTVLGFDETFPQRNQ